MKYVLVTGGVVSGLGKGVTASSIGVVLKACGLRVTSIKIDPYLNTDAGTMSPFEHGEVFVLDDGGEVDLDLGNYERFLDVTLTRDNNITTGKIYQSVLERERKGDYLGKTVQVVPHITDAIKEWIQRVANIPVDGNNEPADVCVIELGGTVGDIESMPFIEALRQLSFTVGKENFCLIHVSLIPVLGVVGEQPLLENTKEKLSQFCHVPAENILNVHDVPNIWHVPLLLRALLHACIACSMKPAIDWIAASDLEDESAKSTPEAHASAWKTLKSASCVLVPGGFGDRGIGGMILAAKYARENNVPYLGICLGMQISVIEFARSVLGWEDANSEEFDEKASNLVIKFMPEGSRTHMGNTMRLGSRKTLFKTPHCVTSKLYHNSRFVDERHRHRYEVNPNLVNALEDGGLKFVGRDESGERMEILELPGHPYYVGVQFHPEFKSRPGRASAPFLGLILAATNQLEGYLKTDQNGS
uniref:CTP synthase n=1 Tax=Chenopodium quinoa TaxID=63459 RepID=A0A803LF84_CHEQI